MESPAIVNNIFPDTISFEEKARQVMQFQFDNNPVYRQWNELLGMNIATIKRLEDIPFLPISFFKTHKVVSGTGKADYVFESSGTTQTINSYHHVLNGSLYEESYLKAFRLFYGDVKDWCIIGLLPSYLERQHSSLVVMVDGLIKRSACTESGFYLNEFEKLQAVLTKLESKNQKTWLIGATFGLLDFAEQVPMKLKNTTVIETGGMKGRRTEMTRAEVHAILQQQFGLTNIHSEYGMTELLSQAYSTGNGRFFCPPWMKVLIREEEDPLKLKLRGRGILNVIDLANVYSASFIATDDLGVVYEDGSFEVIGRRDNSDLRGCSLLTI